MSNDADVAYALLKREAENFVLGLTGFDVRSHPLAKMAFDGAMKRYDTEIRGLIGYAVSDPPHSVDAAVGVLKDDAEARLNAFSEKFKSKLTEQKQEQ